MAHLWGVSRPTIRSALTRLETLGYIVRRHGLGSYVNRPPITAPPIDSLLSVFEIVHRNGYEPGVKDLYKERVTVTPKIQRALKVQANEVILHITRTITADQVPAVYLEDFLATPTHDAIIQDFNGETLSQFLSQHYQVSLAYALSTISVKGASSSVGQTLTIPEKSPVLHIEQTAYTTDDVPVVYSLGDYREGFVAYSVVRGTDKF